MQKNIVNNKLILGTWAFGSDKWWGHQNEKDREVVFENLLEKGISAIDTAPIYGRGKSEKLIGDFLSRHNLRDQFFIATKCGLSWEERKVYHDLSPRRIEEEIQTSLNNLQTNYLDLYQIHWPDPEVPLDETASKMKELYEKGTIRAIGVSNFSIEQMEEFQKNSPLHYLQPPFSMITRTESIALLQYCQKKNIQTLVYSPLHYGVLTGKFFQEGAKIPKDILRKNTPELKPPRFEINKKLLNNLEEVAKKYDRSLTQVVLNWTLQAAGVSSVIIGARNLLQLEENCGGLGWELSKEDLDKIDNWLDEREAAIQEVEK